MCDAVHGMLDMSSGDEFTAKFADCTTVGIHVLDCVAHLDNKRVDEWLCKALSQSIVVTALDEDDGNLPNPLIDAEDSMRER